MDKGKLIGDAWEAGSEIYFPDDPRRDAYEDGFMRGAEWLQSQPLADRLTEEERENYRCVYSTAKQMIDEVKFVNPQLFDVFNGQIMMLTSIFGKEMFEPKTK